MRDTVTIQDLANALGMSRNTVSKALNGKPVPAKTRNAVINTAIEMGYKGFKLAAAAGGNALQPKRFCLLSTKLLMNIDYYIFVLRGIEEELSDNNVELLQFMVTSPASFTKLQRYLENSRVDGIICMEFFELSQITALLNLNIPIVFMDFPYTTTPVRGHYDILLPESRDAVKHCCGNLIRDKGCKRFGFVGDYRHCRTFYERYAGMVEALFTAEIPIDLQYSITYPDNRKYAPENLSRALKELPQIPDCFIAANDAIAINLIKALESNGLQVPKDVKVIGFDNIPEAKTVVPALTTFNVNKTTLGRQLVELLLDRTANSAKPNATIYIASKQINRAST